MGLLDDLRKREANGEAMRGAGKRFFLNHKSEITAALDQNFTIREIYDSLAENDKLPLSYRTFCEYARTTNL